MDIARNVALRVEYRFIQGGDDPERPASAFRDHPGRNIPRPKCPNGLVHRTADRHRPSRKAQFGRRLRQQPAHFLARFLKAAQAVRSYPDEIEHLRPPGMLLDVEQQGRGLLGVLRNRLTGKAVKQIILQPEEF